MLRARDRSSRLVTWLPSRHLLDPNLHGHRPGLLLQHQHHLHYRHSCRTTQLNPHPHPGKPLPPPQSYYHMFQLECCGVSSGPNDWSEATGNGTTLATWWVVTGEHAMDAPDSCCQKNSTGCGVGMTASANGTLWEEVSRPDKIFSVSTDQSIFCPYFVLILSLLQAQNSINLPIRITNCMAVSGLRNGFVWLVWWSDDSLCGSYRSGSHVPG